MPTPSLEPEILKQIILFIQNHKDTIVRVLRTGGLVVTLVLAAIFGLAGLRGCSLIGQPL